MALEYFFHDNPNPCWIYDSETYRFVAVNKSCVSTYGYSEDEFLDKLTIFDVTVSADIPALEEYVHTPNPEQITGIWRHLHKNGAVLQVCTYCHDTKLNGRICRYVMVVNVQDMFRRIGEKVVASQVLKAEPEL
jgi:PAS domain S-box-containing protein